MLSGRLKRRHARATISTDKAFETLIAYSEPKRVNEDERVAQQPFMKTLAVWTVRRVPVIAGPVRGSFP
jgi:hypothetical protein